jgi:hypothetical protein
MAAQHCQDTVIQTVHASRWLKLWRKQALALDSTEFYDVPITYQRKNAHKFH